MTPILGPQPANSLPANSQPTTASQQRLGPTSYALPGRAIVSPTLPTQIITKGLYIHPSSPDASQNQMHHRDLPHAVAAAPAASPDASRSHISRCIAGIYQMR